ncbi:metal-dependent hydrolase [Halorarius litoreus]|uniref:metal-dependent hydrolase n=1 Tax=Halorarius litoreus TaxID=2962676 RepID=UPI0020CE45D5|nr:metal-dependent hydrolase [Halorarius litoreus]
MWPWEHLAVGYLLLSLYCHGQTGAPPTDAAVLTVALATQLPDLIDKPLAWQFNVLSGTSIAHSILVALMLVFVVGIVAGRVGYPSVTAAFAIGYLSHLLGDLAYPMLLGAGHFAWGKILWPGPQRVVSNPGSIASSPVSSNPPNGAGFFSQLIHRLGEFGSFLGTQPGLEYLLMDVLLVATAATLWLLDGHPGVQLLAEMIRPISS